MRTLAITLTVLALGLELTAAGLLLSEGRRLREAREAYRNAGPDNDGKGSGYHVLESYKAISLALSGQTVWAIRLVMAGLVCGAAGSLAGLLD